MEDFVRIRYWQQETIESGRWMLTSPIDKRLAEKLLEDGIYEQAEIVPDDM